MLLDRHRRDFDAGLAGAYTARALGGTGEIPDWGQSRVEFDKALSSPPEQVNTDQMVKLRALGLR